MNTAFTALLDALRERAGGSDRKAAPLVGVSQATISLWRRGMNYPDDEQALKIADVLQLPPEYVLAAVRADRTSSRKARAVWLRIAEQFGKAATVAALAIGAASFGMPGPAQAGTTSHNQNSSALNTDCRTRRARTFGVAL